MRIEKHGETFVAYAGHVGTESATEESLLDAYRGHWDSKLAFLDGHFSIRSSEFGVYVFSDY